MKEKCLTKEGVKRTTEGNVFTLEEFVNLCDKGLIIPYDGQGYFHDGEKETDISVWNMNLKPEDVWGKYIYVVWYNK